MTRLQFFLCIFVKILKRSHLELREIRAGQAEVTAGIAADVPIARPGAGD